MRRRAIPFVQQATEADCGAACLAMTLGWLGKPVALEEVREAAGVSRYGASAAALVEAAAGFGLRARGLRVDEIDDLARLPRGTILHWGFTHFVVLDRADRRGGARILDPAVGRRRVDRDELDRSFTGVAIVLEPGEGFEPGPTARRPPRARRYLRAIVGSGLLAKILATAVLVRLLALAVPLLLAVVVDRVVPRSDVDLLAIAAAGMAVLVLAHFVTSLLRAHLLLHLRTVVDAGQTKAFVEHLLGLPFAVFQARPVGDLLMRINSNATVRETLTTGVLSGLLDGALVVIYLTLILLADWRLGLVVLALGLARIGLYLFNRRRCRELMIESIQAETASSAFQVQLLGGIELFKATGAEPYALRRWSNLFTRVLNASLRRGRLAAWVDASLGALGLGSPLLVLALGAWLVLSGELTLGTMLAINALAVGFLEPLTQLVQTAFQLQVLGGHLDRLEDVLALPREQEPGSVPEAGRLAGRITLEGVSFRYSPVDPLVLRDVSVEVPAGAFVALVGASGAGKTTLAYLLLGLYRPTRGTIRYDGVDLAALDLASVRRQIGIVPQDPKLMAGSVRGNIAFADPSLPFERVVEAAKRARIHDEVMAMPMGYDMPVGEAGSALSGGQRQRLALARALVHRPRILLLDEATSSLDAVTEAEIQRQLEALDSTRIVIAHRLSTIRNADLILVLAGGRIVERGDHDALMARGGAYAALVSGQLVSGRAGAGEASAGA